MADSDLRSRGMRDLGPDQMERFRAIERVFLEQTREAGYREVRTPTIEPLHLYTASGAMSPQALDGVYSFLDWDGWSGERVVLRPDATVAAARWFVEQAQGNGGQRLSYVVPVYRFASDGADRERWQCGVELFGLEAGDADAELLSLARTVLRSLSLDDLSVDLAHGGLARSILAGAGLSAVEQIRAHDRMIDGDVLVVDDLSARVPAAASALRVLADIDGASAAYVANLRASVLGVAPGAAGQLDELERAAGVLEELDIPFRIRAGTARNIEYYTGVTFRFWSGETECITGGRYDALTETIGGLRAPASGFAADIQQLAELAPVPGAGA